MRRENGVVAEIRIAYGGVGPVIFRLRKTEEQLTGKPFNESDSTRPAETREAEITPISDVRGDADYRFQLAENVLRKVLLRRQRRGDVRPRVTGAEVDA
jgi:xanthine dehydrogenase small subunit